MVLRENGGEKSVVVFLELHLWNAQNSINSFFKRLGLSVYIFKCKSYTLMQILM